MHKAKLQFMQSRNFGHMHPPETLKSLKRQKQKNKDFKEIHTLHVCEQVQLYHPYTGIYPYYRPSCKMSMYHKFFRNIKTVIIYAVLLTICLYFDMKSPCYQTTLILSPFIAQSVRYLKKASWKGRIMGIELHMKRKSLILKPFQKEYIYSICCLLLKHTEEYQSSIIITYDSYIDAKITKGVR